MAPRGERDEPMIRTKESKSAPVGVDSKVLKILEALRISPAGLQLKDIAEQTSINKSTAYRFLAHLESKGYLFRDDLGAYLVGPNLVRLGSGAYVPRDASKTQPTCPPTPVESDERNRQPRDPRRSGRVLPGCRAEPARVSYGLTCRIVTPGLLHGDGQSAYCVSACRRKKTPLVLDPIRAIHASHAHPVTATQKRAG